MAEPVRLAAFEVLNRAPFDAARDALTRCCGSQRWVEAMLARLPFASDSALFAAAEAVWHQLEGEDYLEAFSHHPRLGAELPELARRFGTTAAWASAEQSGVQNAETETLARLQAGNRRYEERFGFTFILCATGKSASEMLAALEQRLANEASAELALAAAEQAKITRLRLEKLAS
jgi:2-oxo-4-hydroxy-4-carboxy-5-ureidoimidazoline decarboxylase